MNIQIISRPSVGLQAILIDRQISREAYEHILTLSEPGMVTHPKLATIWQCWAVLCHRDWAQVWMHKARPESGLRLQIVEAT